MINKTSRIASASRNMAYAMMSQVVTVLLNLASRAVFVKVLAAEYMGLYGLFSNLLGILALAELGFGSALTFSLYKPIKENDVEKIKSLMKLYKKVYWCIGSVIFVIGLGLTPFIDFFIKERPSIPHLEIIFLLFVVQSSITYFFSYKTSFLTATQNDYILQKYKICFVAIQNILQIGYLLLFGEYFGFLIIGVLLPFLNNAFASYRIDKFYPYLRESAVPLTREDLAPIKKNVLALFFYKMAQRFSASIDTLIVSKFMGLVDVAIYYNYHFLLAYSDVFFIQILGTITPSLGNLLVSDDDKKKVNVFKTLQFIYYWLGTYMGVCFIVLFNTFMNLWLGPDYIFPQSIVVALAVSATITNFQRPCSMVRDAAGLFWYGKFRPVASAIINVVAAVILVQFIGTIGVVLGTIISKLATYTWYDPYIVYKHALKDSLFNYFLRYTKACLIFGGLAFVSDWIFKALNLSGILGLVVGFAVVSVLVNGFYILFYFKSPELSYIKNNVVKKVFER